MRGPLPIPARAAFDRLAAGWDAAGGPGARGARLAEDRIAYLRAACARLEPARVLEIGCGTGLNLIGLADLVTLGVGVDIAPAMVARAIHNAAGRPSDRLRFITADALTLSPAMLGTRFAVILFVGALEHIPPQSSALMRAAALLAPGGRIIVVMPHPWRPHMLLHPRPQVDGRPIATRMLTPGQLAAVAGQAGLAMVGLAGLSWLGRPWRRLPLGRLGSLGAMLGLAYAAELRPTGPGGRTEAPGPPPATGA